MTPNSTIRRSLLPSLSDLVFSTTLVFLFLFGEAGTTLLKDSDTGWHIRTGEWILDNSAVPSRDLFSFSKPGGEWFAWEWLTDVAFALIHRYAGLAGLVMVAGLVIAVLYTLLYRFMVQRGSNVLVALVLAILASYAGAIHWLARPHMFSWIFALLFYWVLEQTPVERWRIFWLAPAMTLWANLHGSFVLGLFLITIYGLGELAAVCLTARGRESGGVRRAGRYGLLLAACGAASLLNPYFIRVHLHIFTYLRDDFILNHIGEFFSPNFRFTPAKFYEVLLLLGLGSCLWAVRRGRFAQALLVAVFAHFSLQSARHIPLYAIFAAPLIAAALSEALASRSEALAGWLRNLLAGFERFAADVRVIDLRPRVYALSVAAALAMAALLATASRSDQLKRFRAQFNPKHFPVAAADFLETQSIDGNLFSTDQWSSYLIYRSFPSVRVFIDGRSDYYGSKVGEVYLNVMSVHHTWQKTLNDYGIQSVLLPVNTQLAGAMKESDRWKVAYDDGVAIVFRKAQPAVPLVAGVSDGDKPRRDF